MMIGGEEPSQAKRFHSCFGWKAAAPAAINNSMLIRNATVADASNIADLLNQLGYEAGTELVACKLAELSRSANDAVFLAIHGERVVGCLSAHAHELFHVPGRLGPDHRPRR
jgi:hypothetical protein